MADVSTDAVSGRQAGAKAVRTGLRDRTRGQLAGMLKLGAERLTELDQALAKTETSNWTFGAVLTSVSSGIVHSEVLWSRAKAALETLDRAPGRAAAAFASRTRVPVRAAVQQLTELEKRLESKVGADDQT